MTQPTPPRRRWFQFGLRTMFVVVTVVAIFVAYHVNWIRQRREFLAVERQTLEEHQFYGEIDSRNSRRAPGMLSLFAESGRESVDVWAEKEADVPEHESPRAREAMRLFPEASVWVWWESRNGAGEREIVGLPASDER